MLAKPEPGGEVLKQRCFAVARVPAQDHKPDSSLPNFAIQRFFKVRFNVSLSGKIRIEAPRLTVPPSRTRIGLQQGNQPFHLLLMEFCLCIFLYLRDRMSFPAQGFLSLRSPFRLRLYWLRCFEGWLAHHATEPKRCSGSGQSPCLGNAARMGNFARSTPSQFNPRSLA